MTNEELAERLVFMADVGDMGRKPDPTDTRRTRTGRGEVTDLITESTASVDAEQVWLDAVEVADFPWPPCNNSNCRECKAAIAVIQAYGDARADAARRETLPLLQLAIGALTEAREALHFHYVEWDGEPEDAVPLQLARAKCDQAISALKENTNG